MGAAGEREGGPPSYAPGVPRALARCRLPPGPSPPCGRLCRACGRGGVYTTGVTGRMVGGAGPTSSACTSQGARMTPTSTAYDLFWAAVDDPISADVPALTDAYAEFAAAVGE